MNTTEDSVNLLTLHAAKGLEFDNIFLPGWEEDIFPNKKSIDESIRIGLNYSMMKTWDKDLLNYSNSKNHLLIPGIKNLKDLKEAIDLNCKIIKIYPVKDKIELINISQYKNIDFIAAGGLSISDLPLYKKLGYKAIVIGDKGFKNKRIDRKIYEWLKQTST